ncbi:hypothetical protein [Mesoterricola silvestris]|uniref:Uncharacterized protein n=1 Tax=Mesoterricola silvestris TaxID=2927979 RepID=A0AA48GP29_9BACT|nr:hypothetical protein [Mesoterricola silvestris]BDU74967.1 hypothetical protein METEAL_41410 [Mesoterricola silvestris]
MNPEPEFLSEEKAFEILERPELWPDDPETQARLASLLEIHLALLAEGVVDPAAGNPPAPVPLLRRFPWLMTAAAAVLVALPLAYHTVNARERALVAKDQARIQNLAQKRAQDRLWAAFFQQSSTLIQDFTKNPQTCERKNTEDRAAEREIALALLQSSHGLSTQLAPAPEAEAVREDLHAWLRELSLEDPCMDPQRAQELRQWADAHNLEDEAQRLSRLLKGGSI